MSANTGIQSIREKLNLHNTDQLKSQYLGWLPLFFNAAWNHHAEKGSCCQPDTPHSIGLESGDTEFIVQSILTRFPMPLAKMKLQIIVESPLCFVHAPLLNSSVLIMIWTKNVSFDFFFSSNKSINLESSCCLICHTWVFVSWIRWINYRIISIPSLRSCVSLWEDFFFFWRTWLSETLHLP